MEFRYVEKSWHFTCSVFNIDVVNAALNMAALCTALQSSCFNLEVFCLL
jgi:hypothetical protein